VKKWAHELNKEEVQMASKYTRKYSTSLVMKEMQIKVTLRFHLTPVRMVIVKGNNNNKCWRGCGETGTLIHCWWECNLVQPLWKAVWRFLKKLEVELPYDPVILPLASTQKNIRQDTEETPVHLCVLFKLSSSGNNPDALQLMDGS
jgi:hypothetical protein